MTTILLTHLFPFTVRYDCLSISPRIFSLTLFAYVMPRLTFICYHTPAVYTYMADRPRNNPFRPHEPSLRHYFYPIFASTFHRALIHTLKYTCNICGCLTANAKQFRVIDSIDVRVRVRSLVPTTIAIHSTISIKTNVNRRETRVYALSIRH